WRNCRRASTPCLLKVPTSGAATPIATLATLPEPPDGNRLLPSRRLPACLKTTPQHRPRLARTAGPVVVVGTAAASGESLQNSPTDAPGMSSSGRPAARIDAFADSGHNAL